MVIENQIPKTETVYELKEEYKTPSFEEFMKTYESDDNLSYEDLSGGDISETRGYGPCYVCDKPTVWKDLYMPCPGVRNNNPCSNSTRKMYWVHASCGSSSQISNKAHIRCSRSSCDADSHMSHWSFSCSAHRGSYWETSATTFGNSLSMVMNVGDYGEFVNDIIVYMSNHRRDSEVKSNW